MDAREEIEGLLKWYQDHARPVLQNHQPECVEEFDTDAARLAERAKSLNDSMAVCFLGNAGVGKSTLINALVAGKDLILPSGGVGSLTAQALRVQYGQEPSFEVNYHTSGDLWRVAAALELDHRRKNNLLDVKIAPAPLLAPADAEPYMLDDPDLSLDDNNDGEGFSKLGEFRKLALLMVRGRQDAEADLPYLIDCLREATGNERVWGTPAKEEDRSRIEGLKAALARAKKNEPLRRSGSAADKEFIAVLKHHAAGYLAPLVDSMKVIWNSNLLAQGIELVDLPGVGVSGDIHSKVTQKFIRENAKGIVLVVGRSGVTTADAALLRDSEFLNRLMHSQHDHSADPIVLMIAVVRVDDVAESRYAEDDSRAPQEHFTEICGEFDRTIKSQLRAELERIFETGVEGLKQGRKDIIDRVLAGLRVQPLSAIQYRKFLAKNPISPAFIQSADESHVPTFIGHLESVAKERKRLQIERLAEFRDTLHKSVKNKLKLIQAQWEENSRAALEAEKLREELEDFIKPLRDEFKVRQGQFRECLKSTIPQRIATEVANARVTAGQSMNHFLASLRITHWSTLRAAVRRGGTYLGSRHIDLPRDFSLCFEEPVAEVWGKSILLEIRRKTKEYADDCVGMVEQVVDWARSKDSRVQPKLVEAQADSIKADRDRLVKVGKEAVEELREKVKNDLIRSVEGKIREKCDKFVESGYDKNPGVKNRILLLCQALSEEVTEVACVVALKLLTENYRIVEKDIAKVFKNYEDPLGTCANAIIATHEERVRRSDAQKRKSVLAEVGAAIINDPMERN